MKKRQRNIINMLVAIVMAIIVFVPSLADAREKPRPAKPSHSMTQMQHKIHKNSVAHKKHKVHHDNRNYRRWHHNNRHYYDYYYYYPGYYSAYMNGPWAYRLDYVYGYPDVEDVAAIALQQAYLQHLQNQAQQQTQVVVVQPTQASTSGPQTAILVEHSESW